MRIMFNNETPRPGTVGAAAENLSAFSGGEPVLILPQAARAVNPLRTHEDLRRQATEREVYHRERAAYHRERAKRWLEWGHLSPWHAAQYREHVDAVAWHLNLADRHARIGASIEGMES